ncbi:hypothetical protein FOMPIDRAFT_160398 [Fomitopsis schrenkii]|uniref:Uncharacterized protein n=1 Tax=Fomitopsis schrenkii TaxID=2126942 RepID=S8EBI3_FOMSC|nr:hypothetical protein FOMPIDRAFT_160398 [Fomitopsis schrenkii]
MPPATPVPYTGCPQCTACREYLHSFGRIRPLPSDAVLAVDPDGIDWNYHYWGYSLGSRSKRRTIVRPLPRSITNRIPLELFEHILDFLRWHTLDLYNCTLVCSAWHRYSQRLLYSCRIMLWRSLPYEVEGQGNT